MLDDDDDDVPKTHLDLDSGPSSPSSGIPTLYDSRRRPKSRNRSHTTDGSTSSHLLARLVSREEEIREINAALLLTTERLESESSRANAAERRALDYFHRLRIATDNRERADQESARLREELKLYKLQLENAQKEIFRAQDIIDQVAAQRNEAEADAARARTKARKLQEEKLVMLAREEGRRVGYREGLSMGRRIGYDQGRRRRLAELSPSDRHPHHPPFLENYDDDDGDIVRELVDDDEERHDPQSRIQLRSSASLRQPIRPDSAPPVRTYESASPLPVPSRIVHTPSHEHRTPSSSHEPDGPETIHPIPIRASPASAQHITVPPDNWIPRADSRTSHIPVPPPHQPIPSSPSSVTSELEDNRPTRQPEPTPVPPPVRSRDYAYQTSVPVPTPIQLAHSPSLASRTSTHISQYDLVNKRPGSSLRNEIHVGRAGSGSQPSRASTSRSEHREQDRRRSERTEAESIVEQWRADSDTATPPRNPPRSFTPSSARRAMQFYRPREIVTPSPLGDVDEPRTAPVRAESSTPHPPPEDPARARSPLEYLRKRFRQRPSSGGSSSIPNIVVESPSEPETSVSPSATIAAQPELLSPEAANRPLPQDDSHQHSQPVTQPHSQQPQRYDRDRDRDRDRSGAPWPAGFIPYPNPAPTSNVARKPVPPQESRRSDSNGNGYARPRTQSATTRVRMYDAAPLPPGVVYPAPPARSYTSHRHRERGGERERMRDAARDWERERDRERDQRDSQRGYEREREQEFKEERDEEFTQSPAELGRPISLFDSDD